MALIWFLTILPTKSKLRKTYISGHLSEIVTYTKGLRSLNFWMFEQYCKREKRGDVREANSNF